MSAQLRRLMIQANKLQLYVQLLKLKVEQHDQQTHTQNETKDIALRHLLSGKHEPA